MKLNKSKRKKNKDFEIFINGLSVGWHLAKIKENGKILEDGEEYEKLRRWIERHFKADST